jgi:hypothetical protein
VYLVGEDMVESAVRGPTFSVYFTSTICVVIVITSGLLITQLHHGEVESRNRSVTGSRVHGYSGRYGHEE